MPLDGALRQMQVRCDLTVAQTEIDELGDLAFAPSQRLGGSAAFEFGQERMSS